jgi:ribokinase
VLVPNRSELAILTGTTESADPDVVASAAAGLGFAGEVVVTLGAAGALLVRGGTWIHFAAPTVQAVDTTGAGDAFCGALAAMLAEGAEMEDAVRWAVAAGTHAVTGMGAQGAMATRDEVRALLDG